MKMRGGETKSRRGAPRPAKTQKASAITRDLKGRFFSITGRLNEVKPPEKVYPRYSNLQDGNITVFADSIFGVRILTGGFATGATAGY